MRKACLVALFANQSPTPHESVPPHSLLLAVYTPVQSDDGNVEVTEQSDVNAAQLKDSSGAGKPCMGESSSDTQGSTRLGWLQRMLKSFGCLS